MFVLLTRWLRRSEYFKFLQIICGVSTSALHLRHALVREVAREAKRHRALDQLLGRRLLGWWAAVRHPRRRRQLQRLRLLRRRRPPLLGQRNLGRRDRGHFSHRDATKQNQTSTWSWRPIAGHRSYIPPTSFKE